MVNKGVNMAKYNPSTNSVGDQYVDWFVFEPVDTAVVGNRFITDDILLNEPLSGTMRVPVSRYSTQFRDMSVDGITTLRQLLDAIYAFYNQDISLEDLADHEEDDDMYIKSARLVLRSGERVKWLDLIGMRECGFPGMECGSTDLANRRHPFLCNGAVRFEGYSNGILSLGS